MFVIRNTTTGALSEPFAVSSRFQWPNGDWCELAPFDGCQTEGFQVHALQETESGTGGNISYGSPSYSNGVVSRTVTRTKTDADLLLEATAWIRNRRAGYRVAVLETKGVSQGDEIDGLGFVIDAVLTQIGASAQAGAISLTTEMTALLTAIAAVKQANPKP